MMMLKGKILNVNFLKPSTLKLVMIISKHWKILSQSESSKVEIIWLLKCVMSRCSLRFNGDLGDTFIMCHVPWDGESRKNFNMAWSKSVFGVKHGLAPYFKTLLQTTLEKAEILSYSFEESLNEVTQKSEMDLFARF